MSYVDPSGNQCQAAKDRLAASTSKGKNETKTATKLTEHQDSSCKGSGDGRNPNYEGYVKSGKGQPPQNFSPEGAGKNGSFREAKRASGVPVSQQPSKIVDPGIGKNGKPIVGGGKDYYFKDSNGNEVVIRQHNEHIYEDDPIQNRGTHFNDKYGNRYDYDE
ncbi:HNH/endonuclease VII toxin of polymorphic toxin system component [Lachnotalea glycerini]|uniref:HNH/endonuclease VII toxin of polymorphic toxin system component n=1 Tax=Lachnotalea glycerini TaxID=1763509 RepID=A0A318EHN4_9FIRM|nr:HNH/endonuclease VII toxin of polymorphic toxin system component [Lachnotalea glycerini]